VKINFINKNTFHGLMLIYQLYLKKIAPMKIFKFTLIALITTAILSCSDNSYESELELTNESLAGNHNITILNIDIESSAEVAGVPVTISNTTIDGDTFQVDVVFNTNGTYTAGGQYRVTSTVTPVATPPVTNTEIIVFNNSGSYSINTDENTITFMVQDQALLSGTFNVADFNENSISLDQQVEETVGDITSLINMNISLERI
jgi:hypothetical protein